MKLEKIFFSLVFVLVSSVAVFAFDGSNLKEECCFVMQNEPEDVLIFLGLSKVNCDELQQQDCKNKTYSYKFMQSLSSSQIDQINSIQKTNKASKDLIADKIKAKKESLDKELSKKNYNKKTVKKLVKEIKKLSDEKTAIILNERQQLRDILKTQQYKDMLSKPGKYDRFAQKLELNKDQMEKIEVLFEQNKEKIAIIRKGIVDKKLALEKEFFKENVNFDVINDINKKIIELSNEMFKTILDTKIELKKTLDNGQFNKLKNDLQINDETVAPEIVEEEKQEVKEELKEEPKEELKETSKEIVEK